jgi:hypothetical protein
MKIGILTVPFNNNYGGLLQAFALKSVLSEMGHDVVFLNRRRNPIRSLKFRVYRLLVRLHLINDFLKQRSERLSVHTDQFKEKYLEPITRPYYSSSDFAEVKNLNIDLFLVGSDQVWRYAYAEESIDDYFFNILERTNLPRISYAASFGTDTMEYPEMKRRIVASLLKEFKSISVREESGIRLLVNHFDVSLDKIKCVLDPTFLLNPTQYIKLFEGKNIQQKYMFTYILDSSLIEDDTIQLIAKKKKITRKDLKAQTGNTSRLSVIAPVEEWLKSIYYADCVITDSFHGTVFSIIFNKPFVVVANPERGTARLKDLLSKFGLDNRIISKLLPESMETLYEEVDWKSVNGRVSQLKKESLAFLQESLTIL